MILKYLIILVFSIPVIDSPKLYATDFLYFLKKNKVLPFAHLPNQESLIAIVSSHEQETAPSVVSSESPVGWNWLIKSALYNALTLTNISLHNDRLSGPTDEKFDIVSFNKLDDKIPVDTLFTNNTIPYEENSLFVKIGANILDFLQRYAPLVTDDLPEIPAHPLEAMQQAYPENFKKLRPAPMFPLILQQQLKTFENYTDVLGCLALSGPFAGYIKHVYNNLFKIDLQFLENIPVKKGYHKLGGVAYLTYSKTLKRMQTKEIHYNYFLDEPSFTRPGDKDWNLLQRVLLASLSTDMTANRHLLRTHMIVAGTFTAVNNTYLSKENPLRVLMYPHQYHTLRINNNEIKTLIDDLNAFFPAVYSYDTTSIKILINDMLLKTFEFSSMDPMEDLMNRGMKSEPENYPYRDNITALWDIIHDYVSRYVDHYYANDAAFQTNEIQTWFSKLDHYIPQGIMFYTQKTGGLTKESVKKLISTFIYNASVEHANVNSISYNYELWYKLIPPHVRQDGKLPSRGVLQSHLNTKVSVVTLPTNLTDDYSYIGLDETGKFLMKRLSVNMKAYQAELEAIQLKLDGEAENEMNNLLRLVKKTEADTFRLTTIFPKLTPVSVSS